MTNYNEELLKLVNVDGRMILSRHASKKWPWRDPSKLKGAVFHQSSEEYGTASGNAKYHVGPNHISQDGLPGLSYTVFVEQDGKTILANNAEDATYSHGVVDLDRVDENALYIGVCFGGNFSGEGYRGTQEPTTAQKEQAKFLWTGMKSVWGWHDSSLFGHYHFGKPSCPGNSLKDYIESVRYDGMHVIGTWTIEARQTALATLGFYTGAIDGKWGPASRAALVQFQRAVGISVNGMWTDVVGASAAYRLEKK